MDKSKLFVVWLNGFLEACGPELNEEQTNTIKDKLNGLFEHEAEPVQPKLSLEELGEDNDFLHGRRDDDGVLYRC